MVEVEIDGRKVQVPEGSTLMDAARKLGIYVPHFCYHKKLSIAANCRMCLVDVEKAPKPLPACATPATAGMVVHTANAKAKQAQRGVMEFLLINHPLDCPICDQGGECQLQDLAVGYGASASRYTEPKRVVMRKYLGPLIAAEEMSRCIHCTRCVRFGQEIAGIMELGMAGRGEHSEILAFVDRTVDSELSGNMIDLCPVGALTSKPFRFTARPWELARRRSVSPHDALGSNLVVQVKNQRVLRVLPLENEDVNECWLSDRDRFSYEGLYAADRLQRPMLKRGGQWQEVEWREALDFCTQALRAVVAAHGPHQIGALAGASSTLEELFLLARLVRGLGSDNVDFRLRQSDFSADGRRAGAPYLGMPVRAISELDRLLLIGSFLRNDHPLLAARVRAAVKRGCRVGVLHAVDDDLLMPLAAKAIVRPSAWVQTLAEIAAAVAQLKGLAAPVPDVLPSEAARTLAREFLGGARSAILLGNAAVQHPQAAALHAWAQWLAEVAAAVAQLKGIAAPVPDVLPSEAARMLAREFLGGARSAILLGNAAVQHPQAAALHAWAQWLAEATGATLGVLGEAANSVGGYLVDAVPRSGGLNARAMLEQPRKLYLLFNLEPEFDTGDPATALAALGQAQTVIAFSPFRNGALEYADAILPIAPFTETSGTFVNCEGRVQSFHGAVRPLGEARPGWKVLRALGSELTLPGFDFDDPEAVRAAALARVDPTRLSNRIDLAPRLLPPAQGAERVAEVGIYAVDAIVRRAESLQKTRAARQPQVTANARTLARFGVAPGDKLRVRQAAASALLSCALDE
ncbi:MAG: NADH-quinone oxidoreductase subunit NuoG, partial [Burkholderiaceae bacterium]|nr:NADH-quinone oxidoreductase subunit NuoG [Burkholderiaceae bacterium]